MKVQKMVASMIIGVVTLPGLCMGTQTPDTDVYSMFGCLYAYGFFLDIVNRPTFLGDINDFISHHFSLLSANQYEPLVNLKASRLDGDGTFIQSFRANIGESLNKPAVVVAMRMEMRADECKNMLAHILSDSNFKDPLLLFRAVSELRMDWLQNEMLKRTDWNDPNVSLYVLLTRFANRTEQKIVQAIKHIIRTMEYKNIHRGFRMFCLGEKYDGLNSNIKKVQKLFGIINETNFRYFVNDELWFVINMFESNASERIGILDVLSTRDLELLIRLGDNRAMYRTPHHTIHISFMNVMKHEKDKLHRMQAIDVGSDVSMMTPDYRAEVQPFLDPVMYDFVSIVKQNDDERMRAFVDEHPEYIDKAAVTWVVNKSLSIYILRVLLEKMIEMGGVKTTLDEGTTHKFLQLIKEEDMAKINDAGIELTIGYWSLMHLINFFPKRNLLYTVRLQIPKYDVKMIKSIREYVPNKWHLFDHLRYKIKDTDTLDEYIKVIRR